MTSTIVEKPASNVVAPIALTPDTTPVPTPSQPQSGEPRSEPVPPSPDTAQPPKSSPAQPPKSKSSQASQTSTTLVEPDELESQLHSTLSLCNKLAKTKFGLGKQCSHEVAAAKMLNYAVRMLHSDGWHPPTIIRAMVMQELSEESKSMKGTMYKALRERRDRPRSGEKKDVVHAAKVKPADKVEVAGPGGDVKLVDSKAVDDYRKKRRRQEKVKQNVEVLEAKVADKAFSGLAQLIDI